jgi:hypothetical protein
LIAGLPAPEGIELRVKTALRNAPRQSAANLFEWPLGPRRSWPDSWAGSWMENVWMKGAAAAAIVCVVAGGGWQVYSHVQPKQAAAAVPHVGSGFSSAGAIRTPHTLDGPMQMHPQASGISASDRKAADAKKRALAAHKLPDTPAQQ